MAVFGNCLEQTAYCCIDNNNIDTKKSRLCLREHLTSWAFLIKICTHFSSHKALSGRPPEHPQYEPGSASGGWQTIAVSKYLFKASKTLEAMRKQLKRFAKASEAFQRKGCITSDVVDWKNSFALLSLLCGHLGDVQAFFLLKFPFIFSSFC